MKIEKEVKLTTKLENNEMEYLENTVKVLDEIHETMRKHECNSFICDDGYTYDIDDLVRVIDDLTSFIEIDKIF